MRIELGLEWDRRCYRLRQDLRVLRRLFPWRASTVLLFVIGLLAWSFRAVYIQDQGENLTYIQAVYAVLNIIFFQLAYTDVPSGPRLAPFFVLAPIIGLALFSLVGFNFLHVLRVFFVRRERGQRWQEALASIYSDHIVVCGLGSIGYRVALQLVELGQPVVGIELGRTDLVEELIDADLPIILGNIRSRDVLEKAGVDRASTVIVCTNQDMANIEAAFHTRELNPRARLVARIFEDEIARSVEVGAGIDAVLSRSAIAAVAFAHAAAGVTVLESFQLDDLDYILARVPVYEGSHLIDLKVGQVAHDWDVAVAFLCRGARLLNEPHPDIQLQPGDDLFLFAASDRLMALVHQNPPVTVGDPSAERTDHVIVCGLGHVGYRIANILRGLDYSVTALEREPSRLTQRLAAQGVCVQITDFRRRAALVEAGIERAQAVVICSDDDMLNLETGLRARELRPGIRLVLRIFEDDLGSRLSLKFGIDAVYSTSGLAAPAFVGAALKLHLAQAVRIGDEDWILTRLKIEAASGLIGRAIQDLNADDDLTVVLHAGRDRLNIPPPSDAPLCEGDEVVVLVSPGRLRQLSQLNRSLPPAQAI